MGIISFFKHQINNAQTVGPPWRIG